MMADEVRRVMTDSLVSSSDSDRGAIDFNDQTRSFTTVLQRLNIRHLMTQLAAKR